MNDCIDLAIKNNIKILFHNLILDLSNIKYKIALKKKISALVHIQRVHTNASVLRFNFYVS